MLEHMLDVFIGFVGGVFTTLAVIAALLRIDKKEREKYMNVKRGKR